MINPYETPQLESFAEDVAVRAKPENTIKYDRERHRQRSASLKALAFAWIAALNLVGGMLLLGSWWSIIPMSGAVIAAIGVIVWIEEARC